MNKENVVSIQIPANDLAEVIAKLKEINDLLKPYLVALTPEERQQVPKMSDKTRPFVDKVVDYAKSNPEFSPSYLNVDELDIDIKAVHDLTAILQVVQPLCNNLKDTEMMLGSEAYVAALTYYNSVKLAAKLNVPSAKAIHEDLSKRFEGQGPTGKKPKPLA